MSWDIFVQDIPPDARTVDEIPHTFVPGMIGERSRIIEKIRELVPFADFSDPAWGIIEGADFSVEVSLGTDESIKHFAFHARGSDIAAGLISDILRHLNLRAFDSATGDIFDPDQAAMGMTQWRRYKEHVLNR